MTWLFLGILRQYYEIYYSGAWCTYLVDTALVWLQPSGIPYQFIMPTKSLPQSCFLYRNDWTKTTHMRAIDVWVILCYVGVFSTLVEYCFVLYLTKSSMLDSKGGLISQGSSLLSDSCHLDRALNVKIGVECQIFVTVIFYN